MRTANGRTRPRAWAIVTLALLATSPSMAQEPATPAGRAFLALVVNQVDKGEVLVVIRPPDVLIPLDTLRQAGLRALDGQRVVIDGQAMVSLGSLAPAVTYELDERALTLRLTVEPRLLQTTVLNLRPGAPPGVEYGRSTSGFLNYAVNWSEPTGFDAATEAGVQLGPALATATLSWTEQHTILRGQTSVIVDQREHLRRWIAGDSFVRASLLGSGLYLGGLRVSREYSLDPYFVQFPSLGLSGAVLTPSVAEVYINDRLVSRQPLQPGEFQLANLPVTDGSNLARVVIRDAFGREQQISAPYYLSTTVLARGLQDYDYSVGFPREDFAGESFRYGQLTFLGQHRYGFSDSLTAGYRLEATSGLVSGGPTLNVRLPFGQLEAAAAASRFGERAGAAIATGFLYTGRRFGFGAAVRTLSDAYTTLSARQNPDRSRTELSTYVAMRAAARTSFTIQYASSRFQSGARSYHTTLVGSLRLTSRSNLIFSGGFGRSQGRADTFLSAGLGICLGARTNASVGLERRNGSSRLGTDVQRSLPVGVGYGYRAQFATGEQGFGGGVVQYQGPYGRYEAGQDLVGGEATSRVSIAGGLVGIGGALYATRPVDQSYALVRVPRAAGVRTYANNQEIGRTNGRGDVLIPSLLPYYGNRLSIADQDVPLDYQIEETERTVAPPYRGGALVAFRTRQVRSAVGTVVIEVDGQIVIPSFGELHLSVDGRSIESPVGANGEFYLENVPPGSHAASVQFDETACSFTLSIPATDAAFVRLGVQRCLTRQVKQP